MSLSKVGKVAITAARQVSQRRHALLGGNAIDKKQSSLLFVGVAQLVEHRTHKPGVVGSIPTSDTLQIII